MNKRPFTTLNFLFSDNTVRSQSPFVPERWIHQSLQGQGCFSRQQRFFKIQFVSRYRIPVGEQHRRAYSSFQFPHIAAPRMDEHPLSCFRIKAFHLFAELLVGKLRKNSAKGMMFSWHSGSGGMCSVYSLIRWYKS